MSESASLYTLSEKLDTLIRIQAALAIQGMPSQREKIVFLYSAGLGPTYIANLLGLAPATVSSAMAKYKKSLSTKGGCDDE